MSSDRLKSDFDALAPETFDSTDALCAAPTLRFACARDPATA